MHLTYRNQNEHTEHASTDVVEAGAPEIFTEAMLEAGVEALAALRQQLCDNEVTLREVVREVYLATHRSSPDGLTPILETGYRKLFPASLYTEMFLTPRR